MTQSNAKTKLIEASYDLMLSKGYAATSVEDLCERAEVSKGSFYHFFGTKEELGLELLDDFFQKSKSVFLAGEFEKEVDPLKKLYRFLEQTESSAESLWSQGCLLGNFAIELSNTHPAVRAKVSHILKGVAEGLAKLFRPVSEKHPHNELLQADHLAEIYLAMIEGEIILSRAHNDWSYLLRGLRLFRQYIQSVME